MTAYRLVAEPAADRDIEGAFGWYQNERAGLGLEFLNELRVAYGRMLMSAQVSRAPVGHTPDSPSSLPLRSVLCCVWQEVVEREYHDWTVDRVVVDTFGRSERECVDELSATMQTNELGSCSFCGKSQDEVRKLIAGQGVHILTRACSGSDQRGTTK